MGIKSSGRIGSINPVHDLRYGEQFPAGHSVTTVLISQDFETYSEAGYIREAGPPIKWRPAKKGRTGIAAVGAWRYTRDPSAEVMCLKYDLKDGAGMRYWRPGLPNPEELFDAERRGLLMEATNSFFEYCVRLNICCRLYDWPKPDINCFVDVAAKSGAWTLPRGLDGASTVLETPIRKDDEGGLIMKRVSRPHTPTKKWALELKKMRLPPLDEWAYLEDSKNLEKYTRSNDPKSFEKLDSYCEDDVRAEDEVSIRCPDLSPGERKIWLCDQAINIRGVKVDRGTVDCALEIIRKAGIRYNQEAYEITEGALENVDQLVKLKAWLLTQGVNAPSITKDNLPELLEMEMGDDARRVLQIRASLGSKSIAKCASMKLMMDPDTDRLHGLFVYCGASRTWRWSGSQVQSQNLPKEGPPVARCKACNTVHWEGLSYCPSCFGGISEPTKWGIEAAEAVISDIRTRSLDIMEALWGDALLAIAGSLRSLFIAGPGMEFVSSDLSSIENVVVGELAGETWMQEEFRSPHPKIYEATAATMAGVPISEVGPKLRQKGKVGALASTYQGWVGAWIRAGADEFMDEEEMIENILVWRAKSAMIVQFWARLEEAAKKAIQVSGQCFGYRGISYQMHERVLYCQLPSGRCIPYHRARLEMRERNDKWEESISYYGVDSTTGRFVKMWTYGGKLVENVTQAVARDIFAAGLVRTEAAGLPVVMHTHDELCCEVPQGSGDIALLEQLMTESLEWCADWPVRAAGGWIGQRYRKS